MNSSLFHPEPLPHPAPPNSIQKQALAHLGPTLCAFPFFPRPFSGKSVPKVVEGKDRSQNETTGSIENRKSMLGPN